MPEVIKTTTLYFKEGSSDKVYSISVVKNGDKYDVPFSFGRRGSSMTPGFKGQGLDLAKAEKAYDKKVAEQLAKGYTPGEHGTPYVATSKEDRVTGLLPQLLNPIDENEAERLIQDDNFLLQEKFDGKRVMVKVEDGVVTPSNKKGLEIGIPETIHKALSSVQGSFVLDGEQVGDKYFVFDCLVIDGKNIESLGYAQRYSSIVKLLVGRIVNINGAVQIAETAIGTAEKRAAYEVLKKANKEGAVFKRQDAARKAGRPASGGSQLKCKFYATASCVVTRANETKRSIALHVFGPDLADGKVAKPLSKKAPELALREIGVGNCTIPPNHQVPQAGAIVEIKYLYANRGGSLYQPIYLGVRDDVDADECLLAQLKYKGSDEEEDA